MNDKSIDDILAELQPQHKSAGIDKLMEELTDKKRPVFQTIPQQSSPQELDKILTEISHASVKNDEKTGAEKSKFTVEVYTEELKTIEADLIKQKHDQAKEWLKNLDPLSSEGLWFKEFAKHYPSELEAALDYLS